MNLRQAVRLYGELIDMGSRSNYEHGDCGIKGIWLEPGIYCIVSYVERTPAGMLRAPVFKRLIVE